MFKRLSLSSPEIDEYIAQFRQNTEAGVHDKGIFKAIFLSGGPGSGKSHIRNKLTGGLGLRVVDSDILFKLYLKRDNIPLDFNSHSNFDANRREKLREKAGQLTDSRLALWVDARLGLVIDLTGKDVAWVRKLKEWLNGLGYETYMVFVNTDLEVALERNRQRSIKSRDRTLPDSLVEKLWRQVQSNLGALQKMFTTGTGNGQSNFIIIDNSEDLPKDDSGREILTDQIQRGYRAIIKFVNAPIKAPAARQWIRDEIEGRNRGKDKVKLPSPV